MLQKFKMSECACGCRVQINQYDNRNRIRKYIRGHSREGVFLSEEVKKKIRLTNSQRIRRPEENERLKTLAKNRIGSTLSNSHKFLISVTSTGRIPWNKDKFNVYNKGLIEKKRISFSGANNPKWKGGIYKNIYPREFNKTFRKIIRKRDNYLCMFCYNSSYLIRRLPVHHIDYNVNNNVELNCITLCYPCHTKIHLNKNKIDWTNFFKKILNERYGYQYDTICQEPILSQ